MITIRRILKLYNHKKKILYVKYGLIVLLFICHLFLRFYNFQALNPFGWDQVDNAWAAKHILIDHQFPLSGMVLKQNSGLTVGPLYYYVVSFFYFLTNLDPIASGIIAGVTSIFSFGTIFFITNKLFSFKFAFVATTINTFSFPMIFFDRTQWPVALIPAVSLIIFYLLYKVITQSSKYIIPLGFMVGLSFHVHFTSIFYPLLVLISLPFFPRKKETLLYGAMGLLIVGVFLIPTIVNFFQSNYFSHAVSYGNSYYHGFHLRRMMQIAGDAFIQFIPYTTDSLSSFLSNQAKNLLGLSRFIFLPLFSLVYLKRGYKRQNILLLFLCWAWFLIPWVIMSTYAGELSDYYFSANKFIALSVLAYLLVSLLDQKFILWKSIAVGGLVALVYINISLFFQTKKEFNLSYYRNQVIQKVKISQPIPYTTGDPESYLYFLYGILKKPY